MRGARSAIWLCVEDSLCAVLSSGVLDVRVYRAAFLPALVALFVAAFSLVDRPDPATTSQAADAFDGARAFGTAMPPPRNSLLELAKAFPRRAPGSAGD